jgi:hypothetical protein
MWTVHDYHAYRSYCSSGGGDCRYTQARESTKLGRIKTKEYQRINIDGHVVAVVQQSLESKTSSQKSKAINKKPFIYVLGAFHGLQMTDSEYRFNVSPIPLEDHVIKTHVREKLPGFRGDIIIRRFRK